MYSKKSWGGNVEPFILVKFLKAEAKEGTDPMVSLLIYEYGDTNLLGKPAEAEVNEVSAPAASSNPTDMR